VRAAAWVLGLVILLAWPAPTTLAEHVTGPDGLNCGSLAPFENSCTDAHVFPISNHPVASFNVLGFVGEMRIMLVHDGEDGHGTLTWDCRVLAGNVTAGPASTMECDRPVLAGKLDIPSSIQGRGSQVTLRCEVTPYPVLGVVAGEPGGPYGCRVTL
jgi:hypothetical protein